MGTVIKIPIVRIGNSRGIRIPKLLLDQFNLVDEVELEVQEDQLVIRSTRRPRRDWEEQFKTMAAKGDDRLLDEQVLSLTEWDTVEWEW